MSQCAGHPNCRRTDTAKGHTESNLIAIELVQKRLTRSGATVVNEALFTGLVDLTHGALLLLLPVSCQRQFKTDPLIGNIANLKLTHPWRLSIG